MEDEKLDERFLNREVSPGIARPHATQGSPRGVLRPAGFAYTVLEKQIRETSGIVTFCVVWPCLSFEFVA